MFLFCWKLYGGTSPAIAGISSLAIVVIAWIIGVGLRIATNDLRWWLLIGFAIAVLAPFLAGNNYQVSVMAQVCVFAMMIFGLNIVTGYTGQISIGHGALVGLSAYTIAILVGYFGWQCGRRFVAVRSPLHSAASWVFRPCASPGLTWPSPRWQWRSSSRSS